MQPKKKIFDTRFSILVGLQSAILLMLVWVLVQGRSGAGARQSQAVEQQVGAKLHAAGVAGGAIAAYERAYEAAGSREKQGKLAFALGELHEDEKRWEEALVWFYRVESLSSDSQNSKEASRRIVALLERLGKVTAAKAALKSRTNLDYDQQKSPKGSVVVAEVGDRKVYLHQVDQAMDELPEAWRKQISSGEGKKNFVRQYVAEEIFYEKAKRLGLEDDPKVRGQLERMQRQVLVQNVLQKEVYSQIKAEESDLENFFQANRARYDQPEQRYVSVIKVKEKKKASGLSQKLKKGASFEKLARASSEDGVTQGSGGKVTVPITEKSTQYSDSVRKAIFALRKGKETKPLLEGGFYYIYRLRKVTPAAAAKFAEVKKNVDRDYRMEKGQKRYQKLVEEAMKGDQVRLYLDRVK